MGAYTNDKTLRENVVWQANGRRSEENLDESIKIRQYFPPSKFCAIWYMIKPESIMLA